MHYNVEDEEANRLKEILFPRKTRASQSTLKSLADTDKENTHHNQEYNLRDEISKLKRGMQAFMEKQQSSSNSCLATPRECLQIIKLMSQRLVNYKQEIEEAAGALIESIPNCPTPVPQHKYFLLHLKFNLLHSSFYYCRRRILCEAFNEIKQESLEIKQLLRDRKRISNAKENRKRLSNSISLLSAFNSWRLSICQSDKEEISEKAIYSEIEAEAKTIGLLSDESRLVLWLQKMAQGDSDVCEILIFNSKTASLRGYVSSSSHENLSSVFETVEDQSQTEEGRQRIRRIEFNLEHSLTKICLIKRNPLRVDELRKDPDYSKMDNLAVTHGLSAREMIGGAVFTPLLNQRGHSIGIIRQYYFDKPSALINAQHSTEIGRLLERGIRTTEIIEQVKERANGIRKQYFLKSIQLINRVSSQQTLHQVDTVFEELLKESFPILSLREFSFETTSTISDRPKFIITSNSDDERANVQVLAALGKMFASQSSYVFEGNCLMIKTLSKIYLVELRSREDGHQEFVPIALLQSLFQKKQSAILEKQQEEKERLLEQAVAEKNKEIMAAEMQNKKIIEACLTCASPSTLNEVITSLQNYCSEFLPDLQAKIKFKLSTSDTTNENSKLVLHQTQEFLLFLSTDKRLTEQQINTIEPLKELARYLVNTLVKPIEVMTDCAILTAKSIMNLSNIPDSLHSLLAETTHRDKASIQFYQVQQNPFESSSFLTYVEASRLEGISGADNVLKIIRKYSKTDNSPNEPLSTVLFINGSAMFIFNCYLHIKAQLITQLECIYQEWNKLSLKNQEVSAQQKNYMLVSQGAHRLQHIVVKSMRNWFSIIKFNTKRPSLSLEHVQNMVAQANMRVLGQFFQRIKSFSSPSIICLSRVNELVAKVQSIALKRGARNLFRQYARFKKIQKSFSRINRIMKQSTFSSIEYAFQSIYQHKALKHLEIWSCIQQSLNNYKRSIFESIRRYSSPGMESASNDSFCSVLAKQNQYLAIATLLNNQFPEHSVYVEFQSGQFLHLNSRNILYLQALPEKSHTQHFEFTCASNSPSRHIVWLIPQHITVSLLQKHYLQAISRSIDESFRKFLAKSSNVFFFIKHFHNRKMQKILTSTFSTWRSNIIKKIRNEQYKWRESFYETNLQVETLKATEKDHKREEDQRLLQLKELAKTQQQYIKSISEHRQAIIRRQLSSKKIEQDEMSAKHMINLKEKRKGFEIWRKAASVLKQVQVKKDKQSKKTLFAANFLNRTVCHKCHDHLLSAFKMIFVKCADLKAQEKSAQKKKHNVQLEDRDLNRLMTFQDDFQNSGQKSRDISIIPISFKQFEASKKENVEISAEEAERVNGGAYKLNPKTLRFLKRMGKIGE